VKQLQRQLPSKSQQHQVGATRERGGSTDPPCQPVYSKDLVIRELCAATDCRAVVAGKGARICSGVATQGTLAALAAVT
jgi:hypothetical protein